MYLANRKCGDKGGSIVYVHDTVMAEKLNIFDGCESLAIKLTLGSTNVILVCLYRSPSLTVQQNDKLLEKLRLIPDDPAQNVLIVGDINLPDVNWHLGTVSAPPDTTNVKLINQQKYMQLFTEKGLTWFLKDVYSIIQGGEYMETQFSSPSLTKSLLTMMRLYII